eukprot:UN06167
MIKFEKYELSFFTLNRNPGSTLNLNRCPYPNP